jgi:hypothetical protein
MTPPKSAWTSEELARIADAGELHLATRRRDGTVRTPLPVWVVRVSDDLYVRAWRGRTAAWFRGAQVRHKGRIWSGGVEKDVTFVDVADDDIDDQIDNGLCPSRAPGSWSVSRRTSERLPSSSRPTISARSTAPPRRSRSKGRATPSS